MKNLIANLIYILAVILVFIWAVGFYGHNAGAAIHLLLLTSIFAAYISIWKVNVFNHDKDIH